MIVDFFLLFCLENTVYCLIPSDQIDISILLSYVFSLDENLIEAFPHQPMSQVRPLLFFPSNKPSNSLDVLLPFLFFDGEYSGFRALSRLTAWPPSLQGWRQPLPFLPLFWIRLCRYSSCNTKRTRYSPFACSGSGGRCFFFLSEERESNSFPLRSLKGRPPFLSPPPI